MFNNIYKDKKVFLTGHTGFKGSWLALWLTNLGANVCGYSKSPNTFPSMFEELDIENKIYKSVIGDILDEKLLEKAMNEFLPDIVFHLAAQPLVRLSYHEPTLTYMTNVMGSLNVIDAAYCCPSVKAFVNITTDKCYENKEITRGYSEEDVLGGYDMYSSSKACVEILSSSFRRSFLQDENSMLLATARAGNVIGGGDWASDRLIPDCIKSIEKGVDINIRNPQAIRPWQHVLEPLSGYLLLGQKLLENNRIFADSFNFGSNADSVLEVSQVVEKIISFYQKGNVKFQKNDNLHEANLLILNIEKAKNILGWQPTYNIDKAIETTVRWYKHFYSKDVDIYDFTMKQIKEYEGCIKWNKSCVIK